MTKNFERGGAATIVVIVIILIIAGALYFMNQKNSEVQVDETATTTP